MEEKQSAMQESHDLPEEITELHNMTMNLKLEVRLKDAEIKVLQERLLDYKNQVQFRDKAEELEAALEEAKESKIALIGNCVGEINRLRNIINSLAKRSASEDIHSGLVKGYNKARITA